MSGTAATTGGPLLKDILAGRMTGSKSPQEVLEQLDTYGIDWTVTEEGTLMIRCWQIGAEGFVSPEQVASIQAGRPQPSQGEALKWVSRNLPALRQSYGGRWIAVVNGKVVAHAATLGELLPQVATVERPFITQIPAGEVVWNMTYAG